MTEEEYRKTSNDLHNSLNKFKILIRDLQNCRVDESIAISESESKIKMDLVLSAQKTMTEVMNDIVDLEGSTEVS